MKEAEIKTVSPFEYAIIEICEPENLHKYREETREEQAARIEKNIRDRVGRIKVKQPKQ